MIEFYLFGVNVAIPIGLLLSVTSIQLVCDYAQIRCAANIHLTQYDSHVLRKLSVLFFISLPQFSSGQFYF